MSLELKEILPGDWFAVAQFFTGPYQFDNPKSGDPSAQKYGVSLGVQTLGLMDVSSGKVLGAQPIPKLPGPFTADEILQFLKPIFLKVGIPRVGIGLSGSIWMSSQEMLMDEDVKERAQFLKDLDIEIAPMEHAEKASLIKSLQNFGLRVELDLDQI